MTAQRFFAQSFPLHMILSAEIARELREVMAAAYSLLNKSLCGRAAEDLAALSLVHDIDHAAMAVVWLGHLLKRWNTLVADPVDFVSQLRNQIR